MSITIKSNAKIEASKIYSLEFFDRALIDEIFDKLHAQDRMNISLNSRHMIIRSSWSEER